MRNYLALIVGAVFAIGGGLGAFYLFFIAAVVPLLLLAGSGFLAVLGCYLIWETLKDWQKT